MPVRCAILDDYQNVALAMADWSKVKADAEIKVFNEPFASPDAAAKALAGFDIICVDARAHALPARHVRKAARAEAHRHHRHAQCRDRHAGGQGSQRHRLRHGFGRASDRRTDRRADDRPCPQDQRRECAHEGRRSLAGDRRRRPPWQDARHPRARPARAARRQGRARLRHEGRGLEPEPHAGEMPRSRRRIRHQGRAPSPIRLHHHPHGAERTLARLDRRA